MKTASKIMSVVFPILYDRFIHLGNIEIRYEETPATDRSEKEFRITLKLKVTDRCIASQIGWVSVCHKLPMRVIKSGSYTTEESAETIAEILVEKIDRAVDQNLVVPEEV